MLSLEADGERFGGGHGRVQRGEAVGARAVRSVMVAQTTDGRALLARVNGGERGRFVEAPAAP